MSEHKIRPLYYGLAIVAYLCFLAIVSFALYGIALFLTFFAGEFFGFDGTDLFEAWWGPILAVSIALAWLFVFRRKQ